MIKNMILSTAFSLIASFASASEIRPNIVFILVDDTGWNALDIPADPEIPGSGSSYYQTPNTSKLALSGTRFSHAYSSAPTCGPSRTSIQYGLTPSTLGEFAETLPIHLPPVENAMVKRLKSAYPEYRAAHFGKWHQSRPPEEIGYDESDGQTMNKEGDQCSEEDPKLTFSLAKKANEFMARQVKDGQPFFLQVSFYANHLDYKALPETIEKYEARKDAASPYQNSPLWAAMNEDLDTAVGRIIDMVEKLGIKENTYFIYTSDNGYESKEDYGKAVSERTFYKAFPLLSHKYLISEGGIRVPLLISGPGVPAGVSTRVPAAGWDIMPTVLDMAKASDRIPDDIEGGSLLPLCINKGMGKVERRDPFFIFRYTKRDGALDIAIVQDGYKLLREIRSGDEHLYSLWDDLGEQQNLITNLPEKADLLRKNMDAYYQRRQWDQKEHLNYKKPKKGKRKNLSK